MATVGETTKSARTPKAVQAVVAESREIVTIPEIGTIRATHPPIIVPTSNPTRDLHDAVKRRCVYHWIACPTAQPDVDILRRLVSSGSQTLTVQFAVLAASPLAI